MKRILWAVVAAMVLSWGMAGTGYAEPVKVGSVTPLTGKLAVPSESDAMLKFEGMPIPTIRKIKTTFGNATHRDIHRPVRGGAGV